MEAAVATLQRALQVDPETIDLHYQLGLVFADQGRFQAALERFERVADKEPNNPDYVANLALALQNLGLLDRANARWQTLCEVTQQTSQGADLLARLGYR